MVLLVVYKIKILKFKKTYTQKYKKTYTQKYKNTTSKFWLVVNEVLWEVVMRYDRVKMCKHAKIELIYLCMLILVQ